MIGELQINGKRISTVIDMQMPELKTFVDDEWIYRADGQITGRCFFIPLSEVGSLSLTGTLSNIELAKPEDNTPDKLAERAAYYE